MDEFKKVLRSLLISAKNGLTLGSIETDYMETVFEPIPYKKLNFLNTRALIEACEDVARTSDGNTYYGIADSTTAHIARMVSKQKSKKSKGSSGSFNRSAGSAKFKGSSLGNKYKTTANHQYHVHRTPNLHTAYHQPQYNNNYMGFAQPRFSVPPRPLLRTPRPMQGMQYPFMGQNRIPVPHLVRQPPVGIDDRPLPIPVLKKQLSDLLAGSKTGVEEGELLQAYQKRYCKQLNLVANKFTDVCTMVDVMLLHNVAVASPFFKPPKRRIYYNLEQLYINELVFYPQHPS